MSSALNYTVPDDVAAEPAPIQMPEHARRKWALIKAEMDRAVREASQRAAAPFMQQWMGYAEAALAADGVDLEHFKPVVDLDGPEPTYTLQPRS